MKTIMQEAHELAKMTLDNMSASELESLVKALGWDKESENAKLPDWYGIEGIKFIYHNEWADPEIEYKGRRCSCYVVEDTMWERWIHDDDYKLIPERESDYDGFAKFMKENATEVKYLCEVALLSEEVDI